MLMKPISSPKRAPVAMAASRPRARLPVCIVAQKALKAAISMMPSTPRFSTPLSCPRVSPTAA
jgi:hypothetical protein